MNQAQDKSGPTQTPSGATLLKSTLLAMAGAALLLVLVVLPAEYGIDPTGVGNALGLTALNEPVRTIEIRDVTGGNETLREVAVPDFGEPYPLPNPAVFQKGEAAPETRTMSVMIPADSETEVKLVLQEGKVAVYSWAVDRGDLYVDFHGHDASFGPDFFVRYEELQEGAGSNGSLTAPFSGEHGWYWLNYNEFDMVVTLTVTGYFDDIVDYGIF
jgi:hypothetical protein